LLIDVLYIEYLLYISGAVERHMTTNDCREVVVEMNANTVKFQGRTVYPEFAWGLDNEILVRDGQVLYPSEDYVDHKTTSVRLLSCLYNYRTHVAALLEADYDLRGLEVVKTVSMKQVKLLTAAEYEIWEGLMIGTVLLVVIVLILSIPAAIEVRKPHSDAQYGVPVFLRKLSW
jgi:hypothetical protein